MALKFDMSSPQWAQAANAQMGQQYAATAGQDIGYGLGNLLGGIKKKSNEKWGAKYADALTKHKDSGKPAEDFPDLKEFKKSQKILAKAKKKFNKIKKKDEAFSHMLDTRYKDYKQVGGKSRSDWEAEHGMNLYDDYKQDLSDAEAHYDEEEKFEKDAEKNKQKRIAELQALIPKDEDLVTDEVESELVQESPIALNTYDESIEPLDVMGGKAAPEHRYGPWNPLVNPNLIGGPYTPGKEWGERPSPVLTDEAKQEQEYWDYQNLTDEEKWDIDEDRRYKEAKEAGKIFPAPPRPYGMRHGFVGGIQRDIVPELGRTMDKVMHHTIPRAFNPMGAISDPHKRGLLGEALGEVGGEYMDLGIDAAKGAYNIGRKGMDKVYDAYKYWTGD